MVRGYAEVVGDNGSYSYSLDQVLMPEDINPDGSFSVKRDDSIWDMEVGAMTINQSLTIVAPDGSVRGYTTDSNTGELTEVNSGFPNGYSTWQFIEDNWENAPKSVGC